MKNLNILLLEGIPSDYKKTAVEDSNVDVVYFKLQYGDKEADAIGVEFSNFLKPGYDTICKHIEEGHRVRVRGSIQGGVFAGEHYTAVNASHIDTI